MPSPLELNKFAQRRLQHKVQDQNGRISFGGYGMDNERVGAFVPTAVVECVGTVPFDATHMYPFLASYITPIQTCPFVLRDGSFGAGSNYRLADYRCRWAYHPTLDRFQYQELQDDPADSSRELWVPILELR